jgi:hypothetical protein
MTTAEKKARFINLSWDLLAYKLYYYFPEKVHSSWKFKLDIPDSEYDELEREYLRLCLELGQENTVAGQKQVDGKDVPGTGMTELDESRPSVRAAIQKHGRRRKR